MRGQEDEAGRIIVMHPTTRAICRSLYYRHAMNFTVVSVACGERKEEMLAPFSAVDATVFRLTSRHTSADIASADPIPVQVCCLPISLCASSHIARKSERGVAATTESLRGGPRSHDVRPCRISRPGARPPPFPHPHAPHTSHLTSSTSPTTHINMVSPMSRSCVVLELS